MAFKRSGFDSPLAPPAFAASRLRLASQLAPARPRVGLGKLTPREAAKAARRSPEGEDGRARFTKKDRCAQLGAIIAHGKVQAMASGHLHRFTDESKAM